jgi:hypothetical protein
VRMRYFSQIFPFYFIFPWPRQGDGKYPNISNHRSARSGEAGYEPKKGRGMSKLLTVFSTSPCQHETLCITYIIGKSTKLNGTFNFNLISCHFFSFSSTPLC